MLPEKELWKMVKLSERVDIRLGYRCNSRCRFCYYHQSVKKPDNEPSTAEVKRSLESARKAGASEIEFTGGEPTVREDLVDLVSYARNLNFVNISILTNGLRLADQDYAGRLIDAGANDFLLSIHGHTKELHECQTQVGGSFKKVMAAAENVQTLNARCRSSTTINGINHLYVDKILKKMIDLNMKCIHLAIFSPVAQAATADKEVFVRYSDATKHIKKAIDRHQGKLPLLSVKYVPFCFMKGYEQFVMNLYQQSFDPDEWNLYLSQKVRRQKANRLIPLFALLGGVLLKDRSFIAKHGWHGLRVSGVARVVELIRKKTTNACSKCRYDYVCDHMWGNYLATYGDSEFIPVAGRKIKNPVWCYEAASYRTPGVRVKHN